MILNQKQRMALLMWLGSKVPQLIKDASVLYGYEDFCDEKIPEWRIIYTFGLAGKIWNVVDRIYVTGYSQSEMGKQAYKKQQKTIESWNKEIEEIMAIYSY